MSRRSILTCAAGITAGVVVITAVGLAQAPASQGPASQAPPTFGQRMFGNPAVSCRVSSELEVEVQFLDKSRSRVKIPPPVPAPAPASPPSAGRSGSPVPTGMSPLAAALAAAMAPPSSTLPAGQQARGFDDNGQPYVEQRLADGVVRRQQLNGIAMTKADGTREFSPARRADDNNPGGTPPDLPADPMHGRTWIEQQSNAMLAVISSLVRDNATEMAKFHMAEDRATDGDLLAQMSYRATIARFFASASSQ